MIRDMAKGFTMHGAEMLCKDVGYIPSDKLNWKPDAAGKSVIDILQELVSGNLAIAAVLRGEAGEGKCEETDLEALKGALMSTSQEVCSAIDGMSDEQLAGQVTMPWGMVMPAAAAIFLPAQHINYHDGQVNYIQLLLGDTAFHWME